jgi:hypothetical protein
LPLDTTPLLVLRLAFLGALYLFLAFVARAAWRELRPGAAGTPEPAAAPELLVIDPARSHWQRGERVRIRHGASLGREPGNALVVDEDTVSARHAAFRRENGRWVLEDLGSTNGTFVNQRRVHGQAPLRIGDEIRFGRVVVRFAEPARGHT